MNLNKLHFLSGIIITLFVGLHLYNHLFSLFGADAHVELMNDLRIFYRNIIAESVLLMAVVLQVISGIKLFINIRKSATSFFEKLQIWSGLYLAFFLIIHVSAVLTGRFLLDLDTNFYFGVAGVNTFPYYLFFAPYYTLAIFSFFAHIAAIHSKKMKVEVLGLKPRHQSCVVLGLGIAVSITILYGLTNGFEGVEIPAAYHVLIGR